MSGVLLTVNRARELIAGYHRDTAIDKHPVAGPVAVDRLGVEGDQQVEHAHGGPDKAVYAFADEDAQWWAERLGHDLPSGWFGENLRTQGLDVTGARVGERWRIGTTTLEVRMPRTPCENLSLRAGIDRFHVAFNRTGRVGAMLRVLEPGTMCAGDPIVVLSRPDHQVTVGRLAHGAAPGQMRSMLDSGVPLAGNVRAKARRVAARAR